MVKVSWRQVKYVSLLSRSYQLIGLLSSHCFLIAATILKTLDKTQLSVWWKFKTAEVQLKWNNFDAKAKLSITLHTLFGWAHQLHLNLSKVKSSLNITINFGLNTFGKENSLDTYCSAGIFSSHKFERAYTWRRACSFCNMNNSLE